MPVIDDEQEFIRRTLRETDDSADASVAGENPRVTVNSIEPSLQEVLTRIVELIESQTPGMVCSILLLDADGVHLRHGAAPSLPESYTKAIDGMSIGPKAGSCGSAAFFRKTVIVTDIDQDPLWDDFRHLAVEHGFKACWSVPILRCDQLLGTFAMYYRMPRGPLSEDTRRLELVTYIAGIAIENARARKALRESVDQSQAILEAIPDSMFLMDSNFKYLECQPRSTCRSPERERILGKNMREVLPTELAEKFEDCCRRAVESGEPQLVEYEFLHDGQIRYSEARIIPTNDGKFLSFVRDITARRQTENSLREREKRLRKTNGQIRELAGRLMTAHEAERRRISRRLYDDLNQRVAALSIVVSSLRRHSPVLPEGLTGQLDMLHRWVREIADGMRQLSHELHPAVLEHIGLAAALKAYVAEFAHVEKMQIDLKVPDNVKAIPPDAAICLYRVAQECLAIVKHGMDHATVTLSLDDQSARLHIVESGLTFDPHLALRSGKLDLARIEERLRFMRGNFRMYTLGSGLKLVATIPLGKQ